MKEKEKVDMKPRILILMHYMELGGAESALLGLLQSVDPERADVDVFIYSHRGELMQYLPTDRISLLCENEDYKYIESPIKECLSKKKFGIALGRMIARWTVDKSPVPKGADDIRIFSRIADCVEPFLPDINPNVEYDLAISFLIPHNYVIKKVKAKRKVGWIHTDYSTVYVDVKRELKVWKDLDWIASISEEVGCKFCEVFPSLRTKLVQIENILNSSFIRKRASEQSVVLTNNDNIVSLLTIGRFSYPKKMEDIPRICSLLKKRGLIVKWFIIGYGSEQIEETVRTNAKSEGVADDVILLGKQDNPYPYIKACDIYVQPSRYEGKSITVREAQILGKPVVVTNYPTAASQVSDGIDGVIVPMDVEKCADCMAEFIRDEEKRRCISAYLREHDYGNEKEMEKIYNMALL